MKEWECVQVDHHRDVGKKIMEYEQQGWILHTYNMVNLAGTGQVKHYLLFFKDSRN